MSSLTDIFNAQDLNAIPGWFVRYLDYDVPSQDANFGGVKVCLFGDSMTSQYYTESTPNASYDPATGTLTLSGFSVLVPDGTEIAVFNRSYPSLLAHKTRYATFISSSSVSVQIDRNLPDLPNGNLAGTTYLRDSSRISSNGWMTYLQLLSGWAFEVAYNGAQSGDTAENALARLDEHCLSVEADWVFMQLPGINDTSIGNGPVSEDVTRWAQRAIVDRILSSGRKLLLLTTTPVQTGESRANLQAMARTLRLNNDMKRYLAGRAGAIVVDAYQLIVNPTNATGLARTGVLRSSDNIHYSQQGAYVVGLAVWNKVQSLFPTDLSTLSRTAIDSAQNAGVILSSPTRSAGIVTATATAHGFYTGDIVKAYGGTTPIGGQYVVVTRIDANTITFPLAGSDGAIAGTVRLTRGNNLFPNALLASGSGGTADSGATGTAAANIRVHRLAGTGTVVASVVARADGFGNNQRVVFTSAAANDRFAIWNAGSTGAGWLAEFVVGRSYSFECELSLSGVSGSNLSELMVRMIFSIDGNTYAARCLDTYESGSPNTGYTGDIASLKVKTPLIKLPAGTLTQAYFEVAGRASAAGTALTLEMGLPRIIEENG